MLQGEFKEVPKEVNKPLNTISKDIKCACCERILVNSIEIIEIPEKSKYKFSCPFCQNYSFKEKFQYKVYFEPVNCKIVNIKEENETWLVQLS